MINRTPATHGFGKQLFVGCIVAAIAAAAFLYGFAFSSYSETELVRMAYLWLPLLVYGAVGLVSLQASGRRPFLHAAIGAVVGTGGLIFFFEAIFPGL